MNFDVFYKYDIKKIYIKIINNIICSKYWRPNISSRLHKLRSVNKKTALNGQSLGGVWDQVLIYCNFFIP